MKPPVRMPARGNLRRRGAAMLEFAIVLPVMLFLLLFTLDVGRTLLVQSVVQDSAFAAARAAAQIGETSGAESVFSSSLALMPAAIDTEVLRISSGTGRAGASAQSAGQTECSIERPYVYVYAQVRVPLFTPGLGALIGAARQEGWTLSASAVARCEVAR
jgi:Flp pilus assembly protein TadG